MSLQLGSIRSDGSAQSRTPTTSTASGNEMRRVLEAIHKQCHMVNAAGGIVKQCVAANGDVIVMIEETSVLDGQKWQARVRFVGSGDLLNTPTSNSAGLCDVASSVGTGAPLGLISSSASGSLTKPKIRTIFQIEDALNKRFLVEVFRILPDGTKTPCFPWIVASDGQCCVQAAPAHGGRGLGLDALPFIHQWIFRADPEIMRCDAVERGLQRLIRGMLDAKRRGLDLCDRCRIAAAASSESRRQMISAAARVVNARSPKVAASEVPTFLQLLTAIDDDAGGFELFRGEYVGDKDDDDEIDDDPASATARFSSPRSGATPRSFSPKGALNSDDFGPSASPTAGGLYSNRSGHNLDGQPAHSAPFMKKKTRKPRIVWRYVAHPIPIPVQTLACMGRTPISPAQWFDDTIERDLTHWLQIDQASRSSPWEDDTEGDRHHHHHQHFDVEQAYWDAQEGRTRQSGPPKYYSKQKSRLKILRTVHVPLPVPVISAVIINPAMHRLVEPVRYMADLSMLSNPAASRIEGNKLPSLWRGYLSWGVQAHMVDAPGGGQAPVVTPCGRVDRGSRGVDVDAAEVYLPTAARVPGASAPHPLRIGRTLISRAARLQFTAIAGAFSTRTHVELLRQLRQLCVTEPPLLPRPWVEDTVLVPVHAVEDTATAAAVASSIVDCLSEEVDLHELLPSAFDFAFPFAHEPAPGASAAATAAEMMSTVRDGLISQRDLAPPSMSVLRGAGAAALVVEPTLSGDAFKRNRDMQATNRQLNQGASPGTRGSASPALTTAGASLVGLVRGRAEPTTTLSTASVAQHSKPQRPVPGKPDAKPKPWLPGGLMVDEPRPTRRAVEKLKWRFTDDVGAVSSQVWYSRAVARGDPVWWCGAHSSVAELGKRMFEEDCQRVIAMREGVFKQIRSAIYNGEADGRTLMKGWDESLTVLMDDEADAEPRSRGSA